MKQIHTMCVHSKAKWLMLDVCLCEIKRNNTKNKVTTETGLKLQFYFCAFIQHLLHTLRADYVDKVVNANHIRFDWITNSM